MKKELTERELEELESALRSFGTPYSSNEPDDRYWANFRVKVMNRIDTKEVLAKRPVFASVIDWFSASMFRPIGAGLATMAVVAALVLSMPSTPPAPQISETVQPTVTTTSETPATAEAPTTIQQPVTAIPVVKTKNVTTTTVSKDQQLADAAGDFSTLDETLSGGRDDEPIDYSDLSDAELQSLLDVASTIKAL